MPLGVVSIITVQLTVRITDELQQPLGLNIDQHRVLEGAAVLGQRFQTALSNPLLYDAMEMAKRNVINLADSVTRDD